jgi:hypothetical protein
MLTSEVECICSLYILVDIPWQSKLPSQHWFTVYQCRAVITDSCGYLGDFTIHRKIKLLVLIYNHGSHFILF